jgi:hypothetical protein
MAIFEVVPITGCTSYSPTGDKENKSKRFSPLAPGEEGYNERAFTENQIGITY